MPVRGPHGTAAVFPDSLLSLNYIQQPATLTFRNSANRIFIEVSNVDCPYSPRLRLGTTSRQPVVIGFRPGLEQVFRTSTRSKTWTLPGGGSRFDASVLVLTRIRSRGGWILERPSSRCTSCRLDQTLGARGVSGTFLVAETQISVPSLAGASNERFDSGLKNQFQNRWIRQGTSSEPSQWSGTGFRKSKISASLSFCQPVHKRSRSSSSYGRLCSRTCFQMQSTDAA
jgi:hypothetical protein